jgi:ribosome biogenesis GTPase / thiamine phosphate phosphatase
LEYIKLKMFGWDDFFDNHFSLFIQQGLIPGRVIAEHKNTYKVIGQFAEVSAQISGRMRHDALGRSDLPAVGDWVAVVLHENAQGATIHSVLPRKTKFSRKVAGRVQDEQIVAANIDTVFIVTALNREFNLRRIERYLTLTLESGAQPVIILSKADLCEDPGEYVAQLENIALAYSIHTLSSFTGSGVDELLPYLKCGQTVALLGSSGAGKSTLLNQLAGCSLQRTNSVREDDQRGRHTTTSRQLFVLPQGGMIIDTPGMRELQLWAADTGFAEHFADIGHLATHCRYGDCTHRDEPGCAVKEALQDNVLEQQRYDNYLKMQKELAYLSRRENKQEELAEKRRWKNIHQAFKKRPHR